MGAESRVLPMPAAFERATSALAQMSWRPEVHIEEIPAPQRIAPFSAAITADVVVDSDEVGSGRLVLLHDPAGNDAWQGTFRCVSFVRAEVDPEMVTDPLLASVGWSWLIDALTSLDATYCEPSGTVTSVSSQSFGGMADDPSRAEVEVRASWTPVLEADGSGLEAHLRAWGELLCTTSGLPPLPPGVIPMPARRGADRESRRR